MLFDNSTDDIFLADFEGNFIEVNQEVVKRLGYSREELMKKKAALPKTKFGDCYDPKHVESLNKLTAANMA